MPRADEYREIARRETDGHWLGGDMTPPYFLFQDREPGESDSLDEEREKVLRDTWDEYVALLGKTEAAWREGFFVLREHERLLAEQHERLEEQRVKYAAFETYFDVAQQLLGQLRIPMDAHLGAVIGSGPRWSERGWSRVERDEEGWDEEYEMVAPFTVEYCVFDVPRDHLPSDVPRHISEAALKFTIQETWAEVIKAVRDRYGWYRDEHRRVRRTKQYALFRLEVVRNVLWQAALYGTAEPKRGGRQQSGKPGRPPMISDEDLLEIAAEIQGNRKSKRSAYWLAGEMVKHPDVPIGEERIRKRLSELEQDGHRWWL